MIRIGLTGGIGAGKSTVARILIESGIPVIHADQLARELVDTDESVRSRIVEHFGEDIYRQDGKLDRKRMAEIVFADDQARSRLNSIVHPVVIARQAEMLAELERSDVEIACIEAALIFEAKSTAQFDIIVVVISPLEDVLLRLRQRDALSEGQIRARLDSQLSASKKAEMADYVIVNDGTLEDLYQKTMSFIDWLRCNMVADKS
ncbi:dephospho-CoA kinase [candidate division KSB1 bacterium]|nr:dephospho-CoA kinase [candidate division KSB1 bacterium]